MISFTSEFILYNLIKYAHDFICTVLHSYAADCII